MDIFEKSLIAFEKKLLANKEQIASDLKKMREASDGKDIFYYLEHLSNSLSINNVSFNNNILFDYCYETPEIYNFSNSNLNIKDVFSPPDKISKKKIKKDSEIVSESFFLI